MNRLRRHIGWLISLAASAALAGGCQRAHSDMAIQNKANTYQPSSVFSNGASARPLVAGVVPREPDDLGVHEPYAKIATTSPALLIPPAQSSQIPFPVTREVLREGQKHFDIFCAVCHGRLGNGQGMIVKRGFVQPPSFHVKRLIDQPDSHFYNVMTNGYGAMFSYNDRVRPEDRWMIVAYIRALQASTAHLSPEQLQALQLQGVRP